MGTHIQTPGAHAAPLEPISLRNWGFDKSARGLLVLKIDRNGPDGPANCICSNLIEEVARDPRQFRRRDALGARLGIYK